MMMGPYLHIGMTVVPVGAALLDLEPVSEGLAWFDTGEAKAWRAIHGVGQDKTMPMQRTVGIERVGHAQHDFLAFLKAQ